MYVVTARLGAERTQIAHVLSLREPMIVIRIILIEMRPQFRQILRNLGATDGPVAVLVDIREIKRRIGRVPRGGILC
ncbi:hypothetical protein ASG75_01535 [Rhodanobacter sp. Soil772]|nr:hypothetical protein ASG75_01535 [Rhodanobacter sp. Soil772]